MTDYSGATWVGSPNYTPGRAQPVQYIALHVMAGYLAGTDATFGRAGGASSTYGVGAVGTVHQYVSEADTAWADGNGSYGNSASISIEHEGGITGAVNTDACVAASARLCADIARRYGWTRLEHGKNVRLHREIYPYSHPACPDKCPNPLRWQEIIAQANNILATGSPDYTEGNLYDMVAAIIQPNDESRLVYWDGAHIHNLSHPDEVTAIKDAYKKATGTDIAVFKLGSKTAPWATRLFSAMKRIS
ncbi:N-acetylmuramoyl-L-alanine amidase [Bifidobacterium biavatii]|uniref:N-acetylmuramoyl-L-alanine amidase n=1 Tax=Bifidobacterium biavatii DSM 23969 TaxID=1437608 RepID=A0A087A1I9_9BIFI|nr:N-acetylmuramoyl-L-alanine amidase [Bifidobacterium biavatii]KFI52639.1 N-acetylmuramoyl-L-alanine amidase [Bifidobacterium biavatii DSM 23969]